MERSKVARLPVVVSLDDMLGPALDASSSFIGITVSHRLTWMNQAMTDAFNRAGVCGLDKPIPLACWAKHQGAVTALGCPCPQVDKARPPRGTFCLAPLRVPVSIVSQELPGLGDGSRLVVLEPPRQRRYDEETMVLHLRELLRTLQTMFPDLLERGNGPRGARRRAATRPRTISAREWQIVQGLMSHKELSLVARELRISIHTARHHLRSVFIKLNVRSQRELLRLMISEGEGDAES